MNGRQLLSTKYFAGFLILLAGIFGYAHTHSHGFHFDDHYFIIRNSHLRDITDLPAIWNAIDYPWRFVTFFTFALNYHFHQYQVFGYHLVNMLIHLSASLCVYWLATLTMRMPYARTHKAFQNNAAFIPLLAALIFIAHPLQTQAVTYITQRFASLATLFYVLTLCLYVKGRYFSNKPFKGIYFLLAVVTALLGMFSKQITITLPLALVLFDFCLAKPKDKNWADFRYLVIILPFLLVIPAVVSFRAADILSASVASGSHLGDVITTKSYALTQIKVLAHYLKLFILPLKQTIDYDFPLTQKIWTAENIRNVLVLLVFFLIGIRQLKHNRLMSFGIFFFFLSITVESSIIPIRHVIFEHRMYLPMVGLSLFAAGFIPELIQQPAKKYATALCLVMALVFLTHQRNRIWQNDYLLWEDALRKAPDKERGYTSLGIAYLQNDQYEKAIELFDKAIEINPRAFKAYNNRGIAYHNKGDYDMALRDLNRAIDIDPEKATVYNNRGDTYMMLERPIQALGDFNRALALNKDYPEAYLNRGIWFGKNKQYQKAIEDLNAAIKLHPGLSKAYNNRAVALTETGNLDQAQQDLNKALKLDADYADAFYNRGNVYRNKQEFERALNDYKQALSIEPDYYEAYNNRGITYGMMGQSAKALNDFNQAIAIKDDFASAYKNRSLVYQMKQEHQKALDDLLKARNLGAEVNEITLNQLKKITGK